MFQSLLGSLVGPVTDLLKEVIPDTDKRAQLAHEIATLAERQAHEQALAQVELNKQEAAHKSLFVAGWRPFIGWTCGTAMAFNYIAVPLLGVGGIVVPVLDITTMFPVLLGMLGLGGMRSFEKVNGVSREK